jgi:hypothetical protein
LGKTRVVADAGESERKVAAATLSMAAVGTKAADAGETKWMAEAAVVSTAALKLYFLIRNYQLGRVYASRHRVRGSR